MSTTNRRTTMTSRGSRQSTSSRSRSITDDQIADLLSKLQSVLPDQVQARRNDDDRGSAARVLQETCSYIRSLHREANDLSERLAGILETADISSSQAAIIRNMIM